jgi:hypothetical protein
MKNAAAPPQPVCFFYGLARNESNDDVAVGPGASFPCDKKRAQAMAAGMSQPMSRAQEIMYWLNPLPDISLNRFKGLLKLIDKTLNGNGREPANLHPYCSVCRLIKIQGVFGSLIASDLCKSSLSNSKSYRT